MFFSKSTLVYIRKSVEAGQILCSHPYKWDKAKHCFSMTDSWKRCALWQFNFIFTKIYWIFMVIRCIQTATSETGGVTIKVFSLSVTTLMALPVAFQLAFACNLRYFPSFVSSYLSFIKLEDSRCIHDEKANPMLSLFCDIVVVGCFWLFWLYCALWTIAAVLHPSSPHVLSSVGLTSKLGITFSTCLWLHFLYVFTANACFMSRTKFPWNFYILQVLQRQREMKAGSLTEAMRSYRAAQILQRDYANSYSFVEAANQDHANAICRHRLLRDYTALWIHRSHSRSFGLLQHSASHSDHQPPRFRPFYIYQNLEKNEKPGDDKQVYHVRSIDTETIEKSKTASVHCRRIVCIQENQGHSCYSNHRGEYNLATCQFSGCLGRNHVSI